MSPPNFTTTHNRMKMNKEDLKIVFLGTPDFAVPSLDRIVSLGYNVVGVVTMPDKPAGRGHHMYMSPVKEYALAHDLHLMQPVKLRDEGFVNELRSLDADLFIVIAFRMLPEVVWQMPRLGTFNLHASLLPDYRGAAPINWAVINGDKRTGVTTFFLKHEIDTGDIIDQIAIDIHDDDNVGTIHDKLMGIGADLVEKTLEHIISGDLKTIPQSRLIGEQCRPAPKIFRDTCHIDWNRPAIEVHNLVRGLSPYPGAWTTIAADNLTATDFKIYDTKVLDNACDKTPGSIILSHESMSIVCGDRRAIEILSLQPTGKRRMNTADYLRGARLENPSIINTPDVVK